MTHFYTDMLIHIVSTISQYLVICWYACAFLRYMCCWSFSRKSHNIIWIINATFETPFCFFEESEDMYDIYWHAIKLVYCDTLNHHMFFVNVKIYCINFYVYIK